MKKLLVLSFICAAVAISCGKKIIPESGANNTTSPTNDKTSKPGTQPSTSNTSSTTTPSLNNMQKSVPSDQDAARPGSMEKGKTLYVSKCGTCHALKNPSDYTQEQTVNFLKVEIPKAKLTTKEGEAVMAYMLENAKK